MKVYVSHPDALVDKLFKNREYELVHYTEANLIVFTGGEDIDPKLYGETPIEETQYPNQSRDEWDYTIWKYARKKNIPMVGICRGAQFLCVMNGGKLKQHDETGYHLGSHKIDCVELDTGVKNIYIDEDWYTLMASANHHQLMQAKNGIVIGRCTKDRNEEIVYWPETNSLGHQPHPEYMDPSAPYVEYFFETIDKLLLSRDIK